MEIQIMTKTSGMIPKKPFEEDPKIEFIILVESLSAVGEKREKTPILHNKKSRI